MKRSRREGGCALIDGWMWYSITQQLHMQNWGAAQHTHNIEIEIEGIKPHLSSAGNSCLSFDAADHTFGKGADRDAKGANDSGAGQLAVTSLDRWEGFFLCCHKFYDSRIESEWQT